jgi:HEAT repeat protein
MPSNEETVELPVETLNGVTTLARALVTAVRNWNLYPPEHPAVRIAQCRLADAIQVAAPRAVYSIGITPQTLLFDGQPLVPSEPVAEAAALLHDLDLLRLTFSGPVPADAVRALVKLLGRDPASVRAKGGLAVLWGREGHSSISLEQVDYGHVLEDRDEDSRCAQPDDLWRSIVTSILGGKKTMDEAEQARLLEIAGDPERIHELAAAVTEAQCAPDGSPLITTQAITVLAAFRHLVDIVSVKSPEQLPGVMQNLAAATSNLDPHVIVEMIQRGDDAAAGPSVVHGVVAAFDDTKVAQILAATLADKGEGSARLAAAFDAIAPDADRKRRVLALAHTMLTERDFGQSARFKGVWSAFEQLLLSYNEAPFVSDSYRTALAGAGGRAAAVAARNLPEEHPEWVASLGQDNVRHLSVTLIIDLLKLESDASRAAEIADDMALLAEDLLIAGDYAGAREIAVALEQVAKTSTAAAPDACRKALDSLAWSNGMQETAGLLGELEPDQVDLVAAICHTVGPVVIDMLIGPLSAESDTMARDRATEIVVAFGEPAVAHLGVLTEDPRPAVQCHGANILGRIASPEAVPLLQPLLRRGHPRVTRHAIAALAGIDDPAAARAIHTVLRAATGELRAAVISALVAERDVRVVPMLVRIVDESQALGKDHGIVIEALGALKLVHTDDIVPSLTRLMRRRRWLSLRRTRRLKQQAVEVLMSLRSPAVEQALDEAVASGDRMLRKIVRQARPLERAS